MFVPREGPGPWVLGAQRLGVWLSYRADCLGIPAALVSQVQEAVSMCWGVVSVGSGGMEAPVYSCYLKIKFLMLLLHFGSDPGALFFEEQGP